MKNALLIVDVQVDFTTGSLAVPGGSEVADRITDLDFTDYDLIVASRDWHNPPPSDNGGHFALPPSTPNYIDSWPVHCVRDTPGAEYAPELWLPKDTVHVYKGQGRPDYSAFQGRDEDGVTLSSILYRNLVERLDIVGIATDHCVAATALHAVDPQLVGRTNVRVLADYCAGVDERNAKLVLEKLAANSVQIVVG